MFYAELTHVLKSSNLKESNWNIIAINVIYTFRPEQMTKEVWDYIFFNNAPKPTTDIPVESLT